MLWIFLQRLLTLVLLGYRFRRVQQEFKKQYEESDFAAVEQDLMRRMRTATNSWTMEKRTSKT